MSPRPSTDKAEIRRLLTRDRDWSLYALADLDDGLFEHCDWLVLGGSLALVFRAIAIRPIFVLGDAASARSLLAALPHESGYLNLKPDQLEAARGIFEYRECHEMHRMILEEFVPRPGPTEPLASGNLPEIQRLYGFGGGGGIAFAPFQLASGMFRGVRRGGELVAVGGVQAVSRQESVAACGNIFTRPDCRGQGLAQIVTSAVVLALRSAGIATIGLNVASANAAAIRAYRRIGFRTRCRYYEGPAIRVPRRE
jgi:ribosomal protein S18 acetylase RimI-like enzyme